MYEEFYSFLRKNESYFDLEAKDFIQFILNCNRQDDWIRSKALQAIHEPINSKQEYWIITGYVR